LNRIYLLPSGRRRCQELRISGRNGFIFFPAGYKEGAENFVHLSAISTFQAFGVLNQKYWDLHKGLAPITEDF